MNEVARVPIPDDLPWLAKPFKLTISLSATCNQDCRLCYADCGAKKPPELTPADWIAFIDQLAADGIMSVFIEGGEPLQVPGFDEILAHATRHMLVNIRTNGTLIDADRAARLKAVGAGRIYVDLFGATAATHDHVAGRPGSHDAALAGLRNLHAAGLKSTILMILHRHNAGEVADLVRMAPELGADQVGILRLYPLGKAKRNWDELSLSLEEQMAALASITVPPGIKLMQSWHPNDGNCCWQNAAVDPQGNSIGCPYLREYVNYGNVRETSFRATWAHPLYQELRQGTVQETCPECAKTQMTRGGCRSTAFAFRGRWDAPDPYCTHLNHGDDLRVLPQRLLEPQS